MADLFEGVRKIPNSRTWYLIGKDTKDKLRVCIISYELIEDIFYIHRETGLLGGKLTSQPDKIVERGKVKRSKWSKF